MQEDAASPKAPPGSVYEERRPSLWNRWRREPQTMRWRFDADVYE